MGVDFDQSIAIGFRCDEEDLMAWVDVETVRNEQIVYEDRFDPKTGKQAEPEKKVIPGEYRYTFIPTGEELTDDHLCIWELGTRVAEHLGCSHNVDQGHYVDEYYSILGLKLKPIGKSTVCGRFSAGPSYSLTEVLSKLPELETLKKKLEEVGINPGEPTIVNCVVIG